MIQLVGKTQGLVRFEGGPKFTPLNKPIIEVFKYVERCNLVHSPEQIPEGKDKSKYYACHKTNRHDTKDCMALWVMIKQLIQSSQLEHYLRKEVKDKESASNNV